MKCQHCDYPLWNLRSRQCPECGGAFLPSEHRFARNSVRFCCPHCEQHYFGTDPNGHLEPRLFRCVACGQRVDMDEMVLLPAEGLSERQTTAEINPWTDQTHPIGKRLLLAMIRGAATPRWMMRSTPIDSPPEQAWAFAGALHMLFGAVFFLPVLLIGLFGGWPMVGAAVIMVVGAAIGVLLWLGFWVLTAHIFLRLGGKPEGGIGRTAHALCYTCGPNVLVLVPCLGIYLGWVGTIWWIVAGGVALAAAQGVSGRRAAWAVSLLPCILLVGLVSVIALGVSGALSNLGSFSASTADFTKVDEIGEPLLARARRDSWPAHTAELLLDGSADRYSFVASMSATTPSAVGVGGVSLNVWDELAPSGQQTAVATAAATLPRDVIAHRLGDFVFTYHGIDPAGRPSGLWLVVEAWDRSMPYQATQHTISVFDDAGNVLSFHQWEMANELRMQNTRRSAAGLPPLPDPFTVLQGRPATVSGMAGTDESGDDPPDDDGG